MRRLLLIAIVLGASMAACAPAFNWREVRPAGSDVALQFPCKPESRTRVGMLGGEAVTMTMVSCNAQGLTFALVHADVGDPARVTPALIAMRSALAANAEAREMQSGPFLLAGMTPNDHAVRVRYAGRTPAGAPVEEDAAFFARAMRVYQIAVLGTHLDAQAVGVFFGNLRLGT